MFLRHEEGSSPFILTVPHEGTRQLPGLALRPEFIRLRRQFETIQDLGTLACAEGCRTRLREEGIEPTLLVPELDRGQLDLNRDPTREPFVAGMLALGVVYDFFYRALHASVARTLNRYGRCFLIDLHSFVTVPRVEKLQIVLGSDSGRTCPDRWLRNLEAGLATDYLVGHSPDPANGISPYLRGGYIVRHAADIFREARVRERFGAVQIEFRREPFFMTDPARLGRRLAGILLASSPL